MNLSRLLILTIIFKGPNEISSHNQTAKIKTSNDKMNKKYKKDYSNFCNRSYHPFGTDLLDTYPDSAALVYRKIRQIIADHFLLLSYPNRTDHD